MFNRIVYLFVSLVAAVTYQNSSATERPNVIVILTDDQGYGDMSCHDNPWLYTPNLDQMHSESVRLEDYHVDPVCTPTRAALMTGRHSLRVGAWTVTEGRQLLGPDEVTMAEIFRNSGYKTGMFGKWHLGDTYPYAPRFRGFDEVVCHKAGGVDEIGNPAGNNYFDDTYFRNGNPEKFEGYCTDVFFNEMLRFIAENKDHPFFVYLPLNAMHGPFTVAGHYSDRFRKVGLPEKRSKFYGMVENFDENLGRLHTALKQQNLDANTITIFMGDNGSAGGARIDQGHEGFNAGMRGSKGQVYEGGHRVACFVRWPGVLEANREVEQLTSHHDWLPTLIEMCNLTEPENVEFDGQSIFPLLKGNNSNWPARTIFIARHADHPKPWTVDKPAKQKYPMRAILTERWRLVNGELYDITSDPGQKNGLAAKHPRVMSELDAAYRIWWKDVLSHNAEYTRFQIGAKAENPTSFTVRDWHPTQGHVIWKKDQLSDDALYINGFWAVDIRQSGRYQITLTRHPDDDLKPMGASKARIRLGNMERELSLKPQDTKAVFTLALTRGPANLQTWITDANTGKERGAYYVSALRIQDPADAEFPP